MGDQFDRFDDGARRVLVLAQQEAHRMGHNYIRTEHLVLGLLDDEQAMAWRILASVGVPGVVLRERILLGLAIPPADASQASEHPA